MPLYYVAEHCTDDSGLGLVKGDSVASIGASPSFSHLPGGGAVASAPATRGFRGW
jgi:hypothetical protein